MSSVDDIEKEIIHSEKCFLDNFKTVFHEISADDDKGGGAE